MTAAAEFCNPVKRLGAIDAMVVPRARALANRSSKAREFAETAGYLSGGCGEIGTEQRVTVT